MITMRNIAKFLVHRTIFYPSSIGLYIRELYFSQAFSHLPLERIHDVLDAGCGVGLFARKLVRKYPQLRVDGCDLDVSRATKYKPLKDPVDLVTFAHLQKV